MNMTIDTNVIIKSTAQRMLEVVNSIAGSQKRHEKVLMGLSKNAFLLMQRENRYMEAIDVAKYLSNKLLSNEGIIVSHEFFKKIMGGYPTELRIAELSVALSQYSISIVPIYSNIGTENTSSTVSVMTTIHRKHYSAMEFSDRVVEILKGREAANNSNTVFATTAMKIGEEIGREKVPTKDTLLSALNLLQGDEVYCMSMAYFYGIQVDPKALSDKLEENGFKVCRLLDSAEEKEKAEVYKFYDGLFALLVSRTDKGIEKAQKNLNLVFKVCAATEDGLPKPANETPINAGSLYKQ